MKVLMTGVDKNRLGGMWTVANNYITSVEYRDNVELKYIPTSTNGNIVRRIYLMILAFIKIKFYISKNNIDIVHIHMAEKGSTFRARIITKIANRHNTKILIHLHAGPFMNWYLTLNKRNKEKIIDMFNLTDKVLVLGKYWEKKLASIVDAKKIQVLYNGVKIPVNNNYNVHGKYITFMGVLKREKGIYDLIDAIKMIDEKLDKSLIVKICGIDLEGNVQQYINSNNLEKRFELVGWVNEHERDNIYKNTILSILPSYYEALSMTVIESMANGIPIITTDISTMSEVLGNNDLLMNPGDIEKLSSLILKCVNDKKMLIKISNSEYERCKSEFDVNTNIKNTLKIYNDIIKKN